ncbi:MAG: Bacterial regulatory protein luxR family [Bacteroidota bacterium]|jgi:DNA-binding NarL/FixJ family response regulator
MLQESNQIHEQPEVNLSGKEIIILKALSDDLSVKMIAHNLLLSEFTVQDYIKRIKYKLGARTASGIVAQAIRKGMIS